jgi:RNA ligase (TIGR02306 family)
MHRKLASIQVVHNVAPIAGADNIECASVLGWQCVVKKGEFTKYDLCVYFEVDSFLPIKEEFEFLRPSSYKKNSLLGEGFRLKTIRLRGQLSQGLALPLSILPPSFTAEHKDRDLRGLDVTEILEVRKWELEIPSALKGIQKGEFPSFIPKTDEPRIQSFPEILAELKGKPYYITTKYDGTSATYYQKDGIFGVCSRNMELLENDGDYWRLARKYDLQNKIEGYAVQGEICGPGIQKNRLKLKETNLFIFSIFDLAAHRYLSLDDYLAKIDLWQLHFCPLETVANDFNYTLDELLALAKGNYLGGNKKEGIVIRPQIVQYSPTLQSNLSFKVLNNDFLEAE